MYRYTKGEGKEKWKLIQNTPEAIKQATLAGAKYFTVLSVDQDAEHLDPDSRINYKGPLYFDIDAEDENDALLDCRRLLLKLYWEYGVNLSDLIIHCTGGKGFHIIVPSKIFGKGKAHAALPYTYKNVALEFGLQYLDYAIYSGGKGRMWRIENLRRPNERYKVRLTVAQIFGLEFEAIRQLTLYPGIETADFDPKDVEFSAQLSALFRRSEYKPRKVTAIADERIEKLKADPGCVRKLLTLTDLKEGRRFNQHAMVLAAYAHARGWSSSDTEEHAGRMIEEIKSSAYSSVEERRRHIVSIYNYFGSGGQDTNYRFSCQFMRQSVDCEHDCCPTCPIEIESVDIDYDKSLGILTQHQCYFKKGETGNSQLTTFTIRPHSIVEFVDDNIYEFTMNTELVATTKRKMEVVFSQPDFGSKSSFIKRLPHPDYAYIGGDTDVQKLFHIVSQVEIPKKTGVRTIGMHEVKGLWHFVTDKGSISADKKADEIMLESDYFLPCNLVAEDLPTRPELSQIFESLFKFNAIDIAVPIVGWFVAAMFKERIFKLTKQFPLLFVFGHAGAGKTQTILTVKNIFALETDNIKSIADVTPFTLIKSASSNNTVPLILDEYKSSTFNPYQVKMVSKLIRAAYNNEMGERGQANQQIRTYYYRSPIVLAGEQTVTEPAARDRIIEVHLSKNKSRPHLDDFCKLQEAPLSKLGKLLLMEALRIDDKELKEMLDKCLTEVPERYMDRPRLNQAIVALGIKLLQRAVKAGGKSKIVEKAWADYVDVRGKAHDIDYEEGLKSDVDRILEGISLMSEHERFKLYHKHDFLIEGNQLKINLRLVYAKFQKFVKEHEIDADIMNYSSLLKLIRNEPYFVKDNLPVSLSGGTRLCMVIDATKIKAKNINMASILEASEDEEETPLGFGEEDK